MPNELKIVIDSDVSKPIADFKKFQGGVAVLEKQLIRLQKIAANTDLSFKNQERVAGLINKTNTDLAKFARASEVAGASLRNFNQSGGQSVNVLTNLGRVAQDAPFGFLGIANNLNPLLESFQRLKASTGTTSAAFKALGSSLLGPAGIGIALSVASSLLVVFGDKLFGAGKKAEEAEDKVKTLNDSLKSIQGQAAKEASEAAGLIGVLKSETETRERKLAALKELKTIQPEIFGQLKLEEGVVKGLDTAYQAYLQQLRLVITAKLKQAQLENITQKILEKEGLTLTKSQKDGLDFIKKLNAEINKQGEQAIKSGNATAGQLIIQQRQAQKNQLEVTELNNLYKDQAQLIEDLKELSKGIEIKIPTPDSKGFDKFQDDVIARARQFAKEFGDSFVVPDLEESFFTNKEDIFKRATKLLADISKGQLKIKLPVLIEFEPLPDPEGLAITQNLIDNFFKGVGKEIQIPVTVVPDLSLEKGSIDKINQKLDLQKQFSILGKFGDKEFSKIFKNIDTLDFSALNDGIEEATKRLQGMMAIATTLNQAIGQGLTGAFNTVFDSILEGKNVFKALAGAVKELIVSTIKAVAQMLILRAITNAILPGSGSIGGGIGRLISGAIGGSANFGSSTGIGGRAFSNVITVNVSGQISGDQINLVGQRAANSSQRGG